MNWGRPVNSWLGNRVYEHEGQRETENRGMMGEDLALIRRPPEVPHIMTFRVYEGHAFLIKDSGATIVLLDLLVDQI